MHDGDRRHGVPFGLLGEGAAVAQTLEQREASGDQQHQQGHGDHPQSALRGGAGGSCGRTLDARMLMLRVLLDCLDLLVALGLRTVR